MIDSKVTLILNGCFENGWMFLLGGVSSGGSVTNRKTPSSFPRIAISQPEFMKMLLQADVQKSWHLADESGEESCGNYTTLYTEETPSSQCTEVREYSILRKHPALSVLRSESTLY